MKIKEEKETFNNTVESLIVVEIVVEVSKISSVVIVPFNVLFFVVVSTWISLVELVFLKMLVAVSIVSSNLDVMIGFFTVDLK